MSFIAYNHPTQTYSHSVCDHKDKLRTQFREKFETKLTNQEQARIIFIPLLLDEIAWRYAFRALEYGARDKVEEYRKLSRVVKNTLYPAYERDFLKFYNLQHKRLVSNCVDRFMDEHRIHFARLEFPIQNEFLKHYPKDKHMEFRSLGITAKLLSKVAQSYRDKVSKILIDRGIVDNTQSPQYTNQIVDALYHGMDAVAGDDRLFDYKNIHISNALSIILKKLEDIEYIME